MGKKSRDKKLRKEDKTAIIPTESVKTGSFINHPVFHIIFLSVIALLIYSNSFNSQFAFDDDLNIAENPHIKNLKNFWPPSGTRWFGFLTFAVNYYFSGLNTFGYHVVNLAIHIFNALLVYYFLVLTLKTPAIISTSRTNEKAMFPLPFFAALLFVSHPIQTQAVTYIVQRFTSLSTMFYLLSMVLYIKARFEAEIKAKFFSTSTLTFYLFSLLSAVLAMKTKEIAFTLPVIIAVYELMFFDGSIKKRIFYLIPFVSTMLIIPLTLIGDAGSLANIKGIDEVAARMSESQDIQRTNYLYTQFSVIVTYIRLLFLPINQNIDYDYPVYDSFLNLNVFLSFLFLLVIFAFGIYLLYSKRYTQSAARFLSFGIFWFFITLSVESSIIPIRDVIFEHRAYLPSAGFFISAISGAELIKSRWGLRAAYAERALIFVMISIVCALSVATYSRNSVWRDNISLLEDTVKKSPNKARPRNNLGIAYFHEGRIDASVSEFEAAIRFDPTYANAHYNLGNAYSGKGLFDEAIVEYKTAINLTPKDADAYANLGLAYYYQGRMDAAINEYKTALRLKPEHLNAHISLGLSYFKMENFDEAVREYQAALRLDPDSTEAHINLGLTYYKRGQIDEAIIEYKTALKLRPNIAEAHNNLGTAYFQQGRIDEAESEYKAALAIRPDYENARKNLESLYAGKKKRGG